MQRDWRLLCSALASLLAFFGLFAIWRGFRRDAEFAINGCPPNVFCEVDHPLFEIILGVATFPLTLTAFLFAFWAYLRP